MENVVDLNTILSSYKGKRVFLTGHTGFKGAWLSKILDDAGALVTGFALTPPTQPNLFSMLSLSKRYTSIIGDVRNLSALREAFSAAQPEIVIHMAAQPLVRESYENPHYTYETNVMGTVNICECIRETIGGVAQVHSFLNVTTDKVYDNQEREEGYLETEPLDGYDPYSNSKSCSELVTHSYWRSFFKEAGIPTSTARAGNVLGGGDFSVDRIVPDCVRAVIAKRPLAVRNPHSVRPYQHVLEPLFAYLMIAFYQRQDIKYASAYNVGPDLVDCITTGELATLFCEYWGDGASWIDCHDGGPHEATFLRLDCAKLKETFNWEPKWHIDLVLRQTVAWYRTWSAHENVNDLMAQQIREYKQA